MRKHVALIAATIVTLIAAGCGYKFTTPAAVQLADGARLVGTTTAFLSKGSFEVADPAAGLTCAGNYDPLDRKPTISAPFACSDGRTGVVTITRTPDGLSGSGTAVLSDGTVGRVGFGQLATAVLISAAMPMPSATLPAGPADLPDTLGLPAATSTATTAISPVPAPCEGLL